MDGECPCLRRRADDDRGTRSAAALGQDAPLLIAVTVLTSMESSDLQDLGITLSPADYAAKLAALTQRCGLDGVVCSAQEAVRFKQELGQAFAGHPGYPSAGQRRWRSAADHDSRAGSGGRGGLYGYWPPGYPVDRSSRDAAGDQRFSAQGA